MATSRGLHAALFVTCIFALGAGDGRMHHLRSGEQREWDEFAVRAEGRELVLQLPASTNATQHTLRLRQRDVKQVWRVRLNGRDLGTLVQDEAHIVRYLPVPAGLLRDGENELRVACEGGPGAASDDVSIGDVELIQRPLADVLGEASLRLKVDEPGSGRVPCRITVVDAQGARVTLGTGSGGNLAVRPGVVYTGDGVADLRLPAGRYTVYAGRGFEYDVASADVEVGVGRPASAKLTIRRVVPTPGWVACDPHVHTLTYSRHGDATIDERMLTLAGEGVELPVATDHNLQVDYGPAAEKMNFRGFFTPIVGNEVTTAALGHFNVFPITPGAKLINWRGRDWGAIAGSIGEVATDPVVILNHARDVHGGFRPFGPKRHISLTGESLDGQVLPANAMEVVNSGATTNDPMRLYRDWFGMLNAGRRLTPIGSSDSHDVARYIVGQGRTYVRCDDTNPGRIDVGQAREALLAGRVLVSYGLMTQIRVNGKYGPGDLVPAPGEVDLEVTVLGPPWVKATRVAIYANGVEVRSTDIKGTDDAGKDGVKWRGRWALPRPKHDVHLVAIATGPGISAPYWPGAKPYQPTSSRWEGYVIGSTGAVWVDADGSGRFDSGRDYARRIVDENGDEPVRLAASLAGFDEAVAAQAAAVLRGKSPGDFEALAGRVMGAASGPAKDGFGTYLAEWRQAEAARRQ